MEFLLQIINGLQIGSIYALVSLGYTMVYGIAQLINFAHGDIIMIGDSQTAHIKGGINFGIDTCWVNLLGKDENPEIKAKYKVDKLSELYEII